MGGIIDDALSWIKSAAEDAWSWFVHDVLGIPERPKTGAFTRGSNYAIGASDNVVRLGESLSYLAGKTRYSPDFACNPHTINAKGDWTLDTYLGITDIQQTAAGSPCLLQAFSLGVGQITKANYQIGPTPLTEFPTAKIVPADYAYETHTLAAGQSRVFQAINADTKLSWTAAAQKLQYKNHETDQAWKNASALTGDEAIPANTLNASSQTISANASIAALPGTKYWRVTNDSNASATITIERDVTIDLSAWAEQAAQLAQENTTGSGESSYGEWITRRTPPAARQIILNFQSRLYASSGSGYGSQSVLYQIQIRSVHTANATWQTFAVQDGQSSDAFTKSGDVFTTTNSSADTVYWSIVSGTLPADAKGQYDIRIRKQSLKLASGGSNDITWQNLVTRRDMPAPIFNANIVGLFAMASATLNGRIDEFSVEGNRAVSGSISHLSDYTKAISAGQGKKYWYPVDGTSSLAVQDKLHHPAMRVSNIAFMSGRTVVYFHRVKVSAAIANYIDFLGVHSIFSGQLKTVGTEVRLYEDTWNNRYFVLGTIGTAFNLTFIQSAVGSIWYKVYVNGVYQSLINKSQYQENIIELWTADFNNMTFPALTDDNIEINFIGLETSDSTDDDDYFYANVSATDTEITKAQFFAYPAAVAGYGFSDHTDTIKNLYFVASTKPADFAEDLLLGYKAADGNILYGLGITPDYAALAQMRSWGNMHDLAINGVIQGSPSMYEVLSRIAALGESGISIATGQIGVHTDSANQDIQHAFTADDIAAQTVSVTITAEQKYSKLTLTYADPEDAYAPHTAELEIATDHPAPETQDIDGWGVSSKAQADRILQLRANAIKYRAKRYKWTAFAAAVNLSAGDVVTLTYPPLGIAAVRLKIAAITRNQNGSADLTAHPDPDDYYPD